ncbi:hypothetical protein L6452_00854 [Arctium lappa]|uniref:Uncharacterized protein n=1 Tax=Arctium lappa TaxID=4217 RepID=A0ACB9FFW4_ARCLA|nr:hypothetical protein L6452_00854 [Arctium lappa]
MSRIWSRSSAYIRNRTFIRADKIDGIKLDVVRSNDYSSGVLIFVRAHEYLIVESDGFKWLYIGIDQNAIRDPPNMWKMKMERSENEEQTVLHLDI